MRSSSRVCTLVCHFCGTLENPPFQCVAKCILYLYVLYIAFCNTVIHPKREHSLSTSKVSFIQIIFSIYDAGENVLYGGVSSILRHYCIKYPMLI